MMRISALLIVIVLTFPMGCGKKGPGKDAKEGGKDDRAAIQGVWRPLLVNGDGIEVSLKEIADSRVVISADRIVIQESPEDPGNTLTYKLDAGKTPKAIDVTQTRVEERAKDEPPRAPKRETMPGIYEINGDELKLCWVTVGPPGIDKDKPVLSALRPTAFEPGPARLFMILRRAK